jgi:hypothetical protein
VGTHTLLNDNVLAQGFIEAAGVNYYYFVVPTASTGPYTTVTVTLQSIINGVNQTNADLFLYDSTGTAHPDTNGTTFYSVLDLPSGLDNITFSTSSASISSPFLFYITVFGQRAGGYTLTVSYNQVLNPITPLNPVSTYTVPVGGYTYFSFPIPTTYASNYDLVLVLRSTSTTDSTADVNLYVSTNNPYPTSTSYTWASTNVGPDALTLNSHTPVASSTVAAITNGNLFTGGQLGGPLAIGKNTVYIGVYGFRHHWY